MEFTEFQSEVSSTVMSRGVDPYAIADTTVALDPLLSDSEVADLLVVTTEWVRSHSSEIPGFRHLGMYYRFHLAPLERWLGSLDRVLTPQQVADLLKVPTSWVYANADQIPGVLRLGRYVRFRPTALQAFLRGSGTCQ